MKKSPVFLLLAFFFGLLSISAVTVNTSTSDPPPSAGPDFFHLNSPIIGKTPVPGGTFDVNIPVLNQGSRKVKMKLNIFLSSSPEDDGILIGQTPAFSLEDDELINITGDVPLPAEVPPGTWYLTFTFGGPGNASAVKKQIHRYTHQFTVEPPSISDFTPMVAGEGRAVRLRGTNLLNVNEIKINGINAQFAVFTNSWIEFIVPYFSGGEGPGQIQLITSSGVSVFSPNQLHIRFNSCRRSGVNNNSVYSTWYRDVRDAAANFSTHRVASNGNSGASIGVFRDFTFSDPVVPR
ncbi:MAG: IPT/TIG domain-containing protein [Bacteroidota bacterium]